MQLAEPMMKSIDFFETQFQRQTSREDFSLNPFEEVILPYLSGEVLDLGCGLGNLAIAAARNGCGVTALDASHTAVYHVNRLAQRLGLRLNAAQVDLSQFAIGREYESIVAIGLLMFIPMDKARALLAEIQGHTRPGGVAAINVLIEGTSFMGMFEPGHYYLFGKNELSDQFADWRIVLSRYDEFPAPDNTLKKFHTLVARKPAA
jgi:tellurite methyltransferase